MLSEDEVISVYGSNDRASTDRETVSTLRGVCATPRPVVVKMSAAKHRKTRDKRKPRSRPTLLFTVLLL
jgi:hypothetical protein